MLNKKYRSLVVAVSFFIGISVSVATSIKINMAENNKIRQTEREKYRDLLPFLMETKDGIQCKSKFLIWDLLVCKIKKAKLE